MYKWYGVCTSSKYVVENLRTAVYLRWMSIIIKTITATATTAATTPAAMPTTIPAIID